MFYLTITKRIDENGYVLSPKIEIIDNDVEIIKVSWSNQNGENCVITDNGTYKLTIIYNDCGKEKTEEFTYVVEDFFLNIEGSVQWQDGNNKFNTRPDFISIILLQDDKEIDLTKGLTANGINEWYFNSLHRYSLEDGHMYDYKIVIDGVKSKTFPEDNYKVEQTGYDFVNRLTNTEADGPGENGKGYHMGGMVTWEDNSDCLGYRPKYVTVNLYQEGQEKRLFKSTMVSSFSEGGYEFVLLPKYYMSAGEPEMYEYTVEEVISARYVDKDWNVRDAYEVEQTGFSFMNRLVVSGSDIGVKPDTDGEETEIKTDTEDKIAINLKQMECVIENGDRVYTDNYSGLEYNIMVDNNGMKLELPDGKYEINIMDSRYSPNDILSDNEDIRVVEENGKWYLYVSSSNNKGNEEPDIRTEEKTNINLKQMDKVTGEDGSISYTKDYTGLEFNIEVDSDGTHIDIPEGKYEVTITEGDIIPSDIIVINNEKIEIVEEDGKWYMYVYPEDKDKDNGGVTIKTDRTENYEDRDARQNFFRVTMRYI